MKISPEAEADLAEARAFYEGRRGGLGDEFLESFEDTLRSIETSPEAFSVVHRQLRRTLMRRFPFSVYYRIEGGEPVIIAVFHSRRNPKDWKSRA